MGKPTIYKPSIYKGNGIYKNGASGGGGGGNATQYSSIYFSGEVSLNLPQTLEKDNLCIIFSFVKIYTSVNMLKLYSGVNANGYVNIGSNGALRVNNQSATYGGEIAVNTPNQSIIIREGNFRRFEDVATSNWSCPYENGSIDKISIQGEIRRIAFYKGSINDFGQDNKIIDFRPCIENGENGFKDIVSGIFYHLTSGNVILVSP